jgi:acyl-CoA synthetase (AMP-forming)/AMP-acid ligase II
VRYIVEHSGASVLLVDPELDDPLREVTAAHRFVLGERTEHDLMRFETEPRPWTESDEAATATINYTSGTAARPKGVRLTHRSIWVNAVTFVRPGGRADGRAGGRVWTGPAVGSGGGDLGAPTVSPQRNEARRRNVPTAGLLGAPPAAVPPRMAVAAAVPSLATTGSRRSSPGSSPSNASVSNLIASSPSGSAALP